MNSSTDKSNGLMGDLESIKALLEEDELDAIPESLSEALNPLPEPVPEQILEAQPEPIDDNLSEDEEPVDSSATSALKIEPEVISASLDTLLGNDFHDATAEVMQRARGLINQHANQWSPQQTDELADALRVRIDGAVAQWIKTSLDAHALELQQRLLNAVRDELARHLEAFERTSE